MALTALEANTITRAIVQARKLLEEVQPVLDGLNIIYNSTNGAATTITQEDLDESLQLSGLTKQQLDDAMFVLTGAVRTAVDAGYTALAHLAARG